LTTLLLILKFLQNKNSDRKEPLYDLYYKGKSFDITNFAREHDIDSYYAFNAKKTIENWFEENTVKKSKIEEVLFDKYDPQESEPQVKFIWYVVQSDDDLSPIKTFNNLNKGKIKLTNAELIKALFVLNEAKEKGSKSGINEFEVAFEWNQIENTLHDDKFWRFLTNTDYNPATRIDLIFNFLTGKTDKDDDDFSYRKFQALFDGVSDTWGKLKIKDFKEAWEQVKIVFQRFVYWYESDDLYHYIGYLISIGTSHKEIYDKINNLPKNKMVDEIKSLIKEKTNISKDIESLNFNDNKDEIRKILLLFNIVSCAKMGEYRFAFDRYKKTKNEIGWDVEHISSQTTNPLQKTEDKITWLSYLNNLTCDNKQWDDLRKEGLDLLVQLNERKSDEGNKFADIYAKVVAMIEPEDENAIRDKDSIMNLTLLDAGTNRSYGNAPFPTKRQIILDKDQNGTFIPPCTKHIFLKYYTKEDKTNSQWKNAWKQPDGEVYLKAIHNKIDQFLK
jgi:hypothetical protein